MQEQKQTHGPEPYWTPSLRSPVKEMLAAWIVATVAIGALILIS
ncbi:MAG: hypothetical protein ACR2PM_09505 [Hyphomicrobiales bacterium]